MPSIKYDAQGNMYEATTDEDSSTGAAPEQTPAAAKATHKRKKGVKRKKPGHDGSAAAASDGSGAEEVAAAAAPNLLSAAAALEEFKELEPELVKLDADKDSLVPVVLERGGKRVRRSGGGGANPAVGPQPHAKKKKPWEGGAKRRDGKRWKDGMSIRVLSNRPECEVPNADHVRDVYSVKRGKG